ncbi:hypothetical protein HWV62_31672 [Athelia sp. TMB]|nr:hypothetical protein HWV62_31672 [Athelia sp. TMB]
MNYSQAVFVSSFLTVLISLFAISEFIGAKLRQAGYDISRLILIGLPDNRREQLKPPNKISIPLGFDTTMTTEFDVKNFQEKGYAQGLALVLALISCAFMYLKFNQPSKRKAVLEPAVWKEFPLKEKIVISPNTAIYRFALPQPDDVLGLPIGQHISVSAEIEGKEIMRSYTPTSSDDDLGHFDLLIKSYEKGNISRYVSLLKVGDKVRVKGPKGQFIYTPTLSREIGMIAGGTGITPMLQIIHAALKNPQDDTKLSLIYANVNPEDILLKKELDGLAAKHPDRFSVYYVLNNPPAGWTGGVGFVSKEQIEKFLPASDPDIKILMCGPPPMMGAMKKHLADLNHPAPRTVSKLVDQVFLF